MRTTAPAFSRASWRARRVHDRGEHAGVVRGRAVHAGFGDGGAAPEVAAADDDRDLDAVVDGACDLAGEVVEGGGSMPNGRSPMRASPLSFTSARRYGLRIALVSSRRVSGPSSKRAKRRTRMFSPVLRDGVVDQVCRWSATRRG